MKELLTYIAKSLVDHPDAVMVTEHASEGDTVLELRVASDDMGKVIGRQGRIAKEIRTLMRSVAHTIAARTTTTSVSTPRSAPMVPVPSTAPTIPAVISHAKATIAAVDRSEMTA